jgi:RimJ/RimL family protein N-acetyltransferase
MVRSRPQLLAAPLTSHRLRLEPLRVDHAAEAAVAFNDPRLHTYIGAAPATAEQLRSRFARQALGHSADGSEDWLNWMVRTDRAGIDPAGEIVGTVQATVYRSGEHHDGRRLAAEVAWVISVPFQGRGLAVEAAGTMTGWLRENGVQRLMAHVHPDNQASMGVARRLGLRPTGVVHDGEIRWTT